MDSIGFIDNEDLLEMGEGLASLYIAMLLLFLFIYILVLSLSIVFWRKSKNKKGYTGLGWKLWFVLLAIPPAWIIVANIV